MTQLDREDVQIETVAESPRVFYIHNFMSGTGTSPQKKVVKLFATKRRVRKCVVERDRESGERFKKGVVFCSSKFAFQPTDEEADGIIQHSLDQTDPVSR